MRTSTRPPARANRCPTSSPPWASPTATSSRSVPQLDERQPGPAAEGEAANPSLMRNSEPRRPRSTATAFRLTTSAPRFRSPRARSFGFAAKRTRGRPAGSPRRRPPMGYPRTRGESSVRTPRRRWITPSTAPQSLAPTQVLRTLILQVLSHPRDRSQRLRPAQGSASCGKDGGIQPPGFRRA